MRAVRIETTEGVRWVNPEGIVMFWQLDGSQLRVSTMTGTFEIKMAPNKFLALMEDVEWTEVPVAKR